MKRYLLLYRFFRLFGKYALQRVSVILFFCLLFFVNVNAQRSYKVNFTRDGFSGYVVLKMDLFLNGDFSCVTYNFKSSSKLVITSYMNGKYDQILSKNGVTFPHTIQASSSSDHLVDMSMQAYFYSTPQMQAIAARGAKHANVSVDDSRSCAGYDANFSDSEIEYLKTYYKNHHANLWTLTGNLGDFEIQTIYYQGFDDKVEKIIADFEREQNIKKQAEIQEQKDKEAKAKAEEEAKKQKAKEDKAAEEDNKVKEESSQQSEQKQEQSSSQSNSDNTKASENSKNEDTNNTSEEDRRKKEIARIEAENERKRIENERKQKKIAEYNAEMKRQTDANTTTAAAAAAAGGAALVGMGKAMFSLSGSTDKPENNYTGSNFFLGFEMGMGLCLTPMYFNSVYSWMDGNADMQQESKTEASSALDIILPFTFKIGYEYEYVGGYGFAKGTFGVGLQSLMLGLSTGGRVYAGMGFLKLLTEMEVGMRNVNKNRWIDPKESGRGKTKLRPVNVKFGVMGTFGEFYEARNHIILGIIWESLKTKNLEDDHDWGAFRVQDIYDKDEKLKRKGVLGVDAPSYTGYWIEWKHDHYGKLSFTFFPKYPITGFTNYANPESDLNDNEGKFACMVSYSVSLDRFYH